VPAPTRVTTRVEPTPERGTLAVTISLDDGGSSYLLEMEPRDDDVLVCIGIEVRSTDGVQRQAVRELADRFDQLVRAAISAVEMALGAGGRVSAPTRVRRELSLEFLQTVVERHADYRAQGLPPTQTLARAENVSDGTVKHWLRAARAAGIA
jgi:hypothetical protein